MTLATPEAPRVLEIVGPTWRRDEEGRFLLPEKTLGWHIIDWAEKYLCHPDGPDAGEPWRFTKEQKRFLLWWYAIDRRGRFLFRAGMLRRMKGWGKDPLAVTICCVEFLGPCRFGGWERDGEPKAISHYAACVQIAAVSQDQVKRNTMSLFPGMLSPLAVREYEIDAGKEVIYAFRGRCRIEMLTSSARSSEGPRPTAIIKNETQHWLPSNGGDEMSAVCDRNAAKSRDGSTRTLAISNAHAPGEMSDAERDYEAFLLDESGFLYDSIEADEEVVGALREYKEPGDIEPGREGELKAILTRGLDRCAGDADWLDRERLLAECKAPKTALNTALRFYFNRLAASEERAFNINRWMQLARKGYQVAAGALIVLGFDGSVNRDWTALIATELATGFQWPVGIWEPRLLPNGEFGIPTDEVDAAVDECMSRYRVWRLNADPYYWWEAVSRWAGKYNKPGNDVVFSWSTTRLRPMALALLSFNNALEAGEVSHDGDKRLADAIGNAHKHEQSFVDDKGERLWTIEKERPDSPFKIDPAMAACLSWEARTMAIAAGMLNSDVSVYERENRGFIEIG